MPELLTSTPLRPVAVPLVPAAMVEALVSANDRELATFREELARVLAAADEAEARLAAHPGAELIDDAFEAEVLGLAERLVVIDAHPIDPAAVRILDHKLPPGYALAPVPGLAAPGLAAAVPVVPVVPAPAVEEPTLPPPPDAWTVLGLGPAPLDVEPLGGSPAAAVSAPVAPGPVASNPGGLPAADPVVVPPGMTTTVVRRPGWPVAPTIEPPAVPVGAPAAAVAEVAVADADADADAHAATPAAAATATPIEGEHAFWAEERTATDKKIKTLGRIPATLLVQLGAIVLLMALILLKLS